MQYRFFKVKRFSLYIALYGFLCLLCPISPLFAQFQESKIIPSGGDPNDRFGEAVAIDGTTAVVGAFRDDDSGFDAGAAYVFTLESGNWRQSAKLLPQSKTIGLGLFDRGLFGSALDIRNDVIVVGALESRENLIQTGAAYIYERGANNQWTQAARFADRDQANNDYDKYGASVATNGEYVFVSALDDDPSGLNNAGAVYVYKRQNSGGGDTAWSLTQKLTATDAEEGDSFGWYVSADGDRLLVGARDDDDKADNAGAAYIFELKGNNWVQQQKIYANDAKPEDSFGEAVALRGDRLIIGARDVDDNGEESGAAYVFEYSDEDKRWNQAAKFSAFDGASLDRFGNSVAITGDIAVVSTRIDDDFKGAMYVYQRFASAWSFIAKIVPEEAQAGDLFGQAVAMSGTTIISGAKGDDDAGAEVGAAYIYDLATTDRGVLVALYSNTGGVNWIRQDNWLSNDPVSTWYGVETNAEGRVTSIRLPNNNLTGPLPAALGELSSLTTLVLNNNNLTGSIPDEIAGLLALKTLDLGENELGPALSSGLGELDDLTFLSLKQNNFEGAIPSYLGNLNNLITLELQFNQFSGELPTALGNLENLESLLVQNNLITGLPNFSNNAFSDISIINLANNNLTFEDLEPNINVIGENYSPQAKVGEVKNEFLQVGDPLVLQFVVGGENNIYQWSKDGNAIQGATSSSFVIPSVTANNAGVYTLAITNSTVPGLTLTSQPATVTITQSLDFSANLSGLNTIPPVLSPATGEASARLTGSQFSVQGSFEDLNAPFARANVHIGAINANTAASFQLTVTANETQGGFSADNNTFNLTPEQVIALQSGLFYLSIETSGGPISDPINPELRGQLYIQPNAAPLAAVIDMPANNTALDLGTPGTVDINWEPTEDPNGHPVHYLWIASLDQNFRQMPLLINRIIRTDDQTSITLSHNDLDVFLAGQGIAEGASAPLYHLVLATDGSLRSAGAINNLVLTRSSSNQAPQVSEPVDDFVYLISDGTFKIALNDVFSDPDGDPLLFDALSADTGIADTELVQDTLLITPLAPGTTLITLSASDGSDANAVASFNLTINQLPQILSTIPAQSFIEGDDPFVQDLSTIFSDQEALTFSALSDAPGIADAAIDPDGVTLRIVPGTPGATKVTVTATDALEAQATIELQVLVQQEDITPPQSVEENINISFGNPELETSYRLVGLPGDVNQSLSDAVNGTPVDDWIAYHETGGAGDRAQYFKRFDGSSDFTFRPGTGFWLLSKSAWERSSSRSTVTLDADRQFTISLHSGWNIISNPFDIDIPWQAVQQVNDVSQSLHRWAGQFQQATTFTSARSGEAYYFFNESNLTQLRLPYLPVTASSIAINRPPALELSILSDGDTLSSIFLGNHVDAEAAFDPFDQIAPPATFQTASLHAVRTNLPATDRRRILVEEYLPADAPGYRYDLSLNATENQTLSIAVSGMTNFPNHYEIILFDKTLAKRYDLRKEANVSIRSGAREKALVLLIGDTAFIDHEGAGILPDDLVLLPNYPNPFTEETTIEFSLPEPAPLRLVVYDALGRKVRTLTEGIREAGHHTVAWDGLSDSGTRLGSGLYFYQLIFNDTQSVQSMVLRR